MFKDKTKQLIESLSQPNQCADFGWSRTKCAKSSDCHPICECTTVRCARIKKIYPERVVHRIIPNKDRLASILAYCIERIFRFGGGYDICNWIPRTAPGYHGHEVIGASMGLSVIRRIQHHVDMLFEMNDAERMEYVLDIEYGKLLPQLIDANWRVAKMSSKDIIIRQEKYYKSGLQKSILKTYNEHCYCLPIGVCFDSGDELYRLIDGHHRFKANTQDGFHVCRNFIVAG